MKKLFTLITVALMAMSASAAKQSLPLDNLSTGWGSSYDAATKTITFEAAWKGRGWWLSDVDYSAFDEVVVEFEATSCSVQLVVEYAVDGATSSKVSANAGETRVSVTLDETNKAHVKQIYLQASAACTLTLTDAYVAAKGDVEKPQTKDLTADFTSKGVVNDDGTLTIQATEKTWMWLGKWYGDSDFSAFDYLMLELAEPAEFNIQVTMQFTEGDEQKQILQAGETQLLMKMDADRKAHVKQVALQNAAVGSFTVKTLYLATEDYVNSITVGVERISTSSQLPSGIRHNLAGQRVDKAYNGVVIENGRKKVKK